MPSRVPVPMMAIPLAYKISYILILELDRAPSKLTGDSNGDGNTRRAVFFKVITLCHSVFQFCQIQVHWQA